MTSARLNPLARDACALIGKHRSTLMRAPVLR